MAAEFYSQTKQMLEENNTKFLAEIRNIIGQNVETQKNQPATYNSTVISTPTHAPTIVCRTTQSPKFVTRPVHSTTIAKNSTITSQQQNQNLEVETQSQCSQLQSQIENQNDDCNFVDEPHYYNELEEFIIFEDNKCKYNLCIYLIFKLFYLFLITSFMENKT